MDKIEQEQRENLKRLIALDISAVTDAEALARLAELVDLAFDLKEPKATEVALTWGDALEVRVASRDAPFLDYCMANAWANRAAERSQPSIWSWEQPEYQKQISFLKRAINRKAFTEIDDLRRCQIFTNLGNCLSTIGRFVEAQECWSRALELNPLFGAAMGNRGSGAIHYMFAHYDPGHQALFGYFAYAELHAALEGSAQYFDLGKPALQRGYREKLAELAQFFDEINPEQFSVSTEKDFSLGNSVAEKEYRQWCLQHRLFLNPLNDITQRSIAAHDVLSTPSITCKSISSDPPIVMAFFNQMKQEFVSARWQFYTGSSHPAAHFSDGDVSLVNTLDYACFGLAIETVKSAFRGAYSLFDKIAYFVNQYFALGFDDNKVAFRWIWYLPNRKALRSDLETLQNWPLRGLFWLSKDFFDSQQDAADPDAKALYDTRNHLEHKFLRIHEFAARDFATKNAMAGLGHSMEREEFERLTLHLLKLCRAALIYLALAMENHERMNKPQGLVAPFVLPTIDDEWKC